MPTNQAGLLVVMNQTSRALDETNHPRGSDFMGITQSTGPVAGQVGASIFRVQVLGEGWSIAIEWSRTSGPRYSD